MAYLILLRGAPGAGKTDLGKLFAVTFGWTFIELDEIKRRRGDIRVADRGAFQEAGGLARVALDKGENVIAEEHFHSEPWIGLFLGPTGLTTGSPNVLSVWLSCDAGIAARRKGDQGLMSEDLAKAYNQMAASRRRIVNEIILDTTSRSQEQVVEELAAALTQRRLPLAPPR